MFALAVKRFSFYYVRHTIFFLIVLPLFSFLIQGYGITTHFNQLIQRIESQITDFFWGEITEGCTSFHGFKGSIKLKNESSKNACRPNEILKRLCRKDQRVEECFSWMIFPLLIENLNQTKKKHVNLTGRSCATKELLAIKDRIGFESMVVFNSQKEYPVKPGEIILKQETWLKMNKPSEVTAIGRVSGGLRHDHSRKLRVVGTFKRLPTDSDFIIHPKTGFILYNYMTQYQEFSSINKIPFQYKEIDASFYQLRVSVFLKRSHASEREAILKNIEAETKEERRMSTFRIRAIERELSEAFRKDLNALNSFIFYAATFIFIFFVFAFLFRDIFSIEQHKILIQKKFSFGLNKIQIGCFFILEHLPTTLLALLLSFLASYFTPDLVKLLEELWGLRRLNLSPPFSYREMNLFFFALLCISLAIQIFSFWFVLLRFDTTKNSFKRWS